MSAQHVQVKMQKKIQQATQNAIDAITYLQDLEAIAFMERAANLIADAFINDKKIIIAGNGGSLCDAMHFAEELTGYFRTERKALPAIALSEPGHLTCVGNDTGFDKVFSRGVEAYGKQGDIFVGLTTSGNSINLIKAFQTAKAMRLKTIAFLGKNGGSLKGYSDLEMIVPKFNTSDRIQEVHMAAIHIIIEIIEEILFSISNSKIENLSLRSQESLT